MPTYTVKYEIEVTAENPLEAALQVEKTLKNPIYRYCLEVENMDSDTEDSNIIDLEYDVVTCDNCHAEMLSEDLIMKTDLCGSKHDVIYYKACPHCDNIVEECEL
mgnify:CR=1 FL=1